MTWWNPLTWYRAGRAARKADLLLFPWVTPIQGPIYWLVAGAAGRTPVVAIVHNPLPHERRRFDLPFTRAALGRVRGAVVHAQTAAAELAGLFPAMKISSIPMPPILDVELTELPPAPPYRLLYLGYVRAYKGLDVGIDALRFLLARGLDVRLTVAGEFWEPVENWRSALSGLDDVVTLRPGYVADVEVSELLASHHVVIAPYRTATQSAIVPIAHASGRPVAATSVGGLSECVVEGVNGALAPPGDPEAFAGAIERVLSALPAMAKGAAADATTWDDVAALVLASAKA